MPEGHREAPLELVQGILEFVMREAVETGRLEIADRTTAEILADFEDIVGETIHLLHTNPDSWRSSLDHRDDLLDQARKAVERNQHELAVTLYAIWLEHFINGVITRAFTRLGYSQDVSIPLIRELRLQTKATALWEICELPPIDQDSLKAMNRIIDLRNSFVHYKWQPYGEQAAGQRDDQSKQAAEQAERVVSSLLTIESQAVWNGRDKELIAHLHEQVDQRRQTRNLED